MEQSHHDGVDVLPKPLPQVRKAKLEDIAEAFALGLKDFLNAPLYGLFFGGFFAFGGAVMLYVLTELKQPWWILPIAVGFPLVGPFAAIGLYEVSRRRAARIPLKWSAVLSAVVAQRTRQLPLMAFAVLFIFWVWLYQVRTLVALFAGLNPFSTLESFFDFALGTPDGWMFLAVGSCVGAVMALALFSVTVIAIPLLLDREIDVMSAIIVSIKAVFESPAVMLGWGVVVTFAALTGIATGFLGLALIFPVLGHTTWHLYRRLVLED
ncbi:MAG: DUF2189 domain-containing protein [Pseudomonadota bacterium]